jgi:Uma2 family endonuclease
MTVAVQERRFTPEDLLTMQDGNHYELVDGNLVEKEIGTESAWVAGMLGRLLGNYAAEKQLGWVLPSEASYQCFPEDPRRVRRPDVSFIRAGRLPGERLPKGHTSIAPDLAVEVVSPNDLYWEVRQKVGEYLRAGVRLVWVIDPDSRYVEVSRAGGSFALLQGEEVIDGEEVLPGFRCRVVDILPPNRDPAAPEAGEDAPP